MPKSISHPISGCPDALVGFPWLGVSSSFAVFDAAEFGQRVLTKMGGRTFREVAPEIGVGHATLNRVARGKMPDVQTYLRVSAWLTTKDLIPESNAGVREAIAREYADEFMSVNITRDGVVTSHNAYDANFDEMVDATRKIIAALQTRLDNRLKCPFAAGQELRKGLEL